MTPYIIFAFVLGFTVGVAGSVFALAWAFGDVVTAFVAP